VKPLVDEDEQHRLPKGQKVLARNSFGAVHSCHGHSLPSLSLLLLLGVWCILTTALFASHYPT
jgi:hypothetical protein